MKADTKPRTPEQLRKAWLRKRRLQDAGWILLGALIAVVLVTLVLGGIYARFFAPCDQVGWMPVKETPNRCLQVDVR